MPGEPLPNPTLEYSSPPTPPPALNALERTAVAAVFLMCGVFLMFAIPSMVFPGGPDFGDVLALASFAAIVAILETLTVVRPTPTMCGLMTVILAGLSVFSIVNLHELTLTGFLLFGASTATFLHAAIGHFRWYRRLSAWKRTTHPQ